QMQASASVDAGLVFFFQAEDGIRAFHVTGVQTCALPILETLDGVLVLDEVGKAEVAAGAGTTRDALDQDVVVLAGGVVSPAGARSEERRVGKESRSRWGANATSRRRTRSEV